MVILERQITLLNLEKNKLFYDLIYLMNSNESVIVLMYLLNKYEKEPSIHEISLFMEIEESKLISIIESVAFTHEMNIEYSDDNREKLDNKILIDSELNELDLFSKTLIELSTSLSNP